MVGFHRILITVAFAMIALASVGESREYQTDVYIPIDGLMLRLKAIPAILDIQKLISVVLGGLECLGGGAGTEISKLRTNMKNQLPEGVEIKLNFPPELIEAIKNYTHTDNFRQIHDFLWVDPDSEWNDLIAYMYKNGFNNETDYNHTSIYEIFKDIYAQLGAPDDLMLPEMPPTQTPFSNKREKRTIPQQKLSAMELNLQQIMLAEPNACDLQKVIEDLINSHGLEWLELLRYAIKQLNTNPSVHVLWAKLAEHRKGESFRTFRELDAMRQLIETINDEFKKNELVQVVIGILEALTGIDFSELNINVVSNVISIVEYLVWRTPFPMPS